MLLAWRVLPLGLVATFLAVSKCTATALATTVAILGGAVLEGVEFQVTRVIDFQVVNVEII